MTSKPTAEFLAQLVAHRTVSRDANEALIGFVAAQVQEAGGAVRVLPGRVAGKANLLARFGPDAGGGIVLSGHSDVVPVDGQDWHSDPFTLTARGDHLLARGAVDMKGFIASALNVLARRPVLSRPVYLAVSHDEEIGCVGVRSMLETMAAEGFAARGCIIGEPTGMRVAVGHKGKVAGCICCIGEAAHSAKPALGCNAIYLAGGMMREMQALQDWLVAHGARDAAYEVPHSTVQIGTIAGGTVLNIVPARCEMKFEFRLLPGDDAAPLLARLRAAGDRLAAVETAQGRHAAITVEAQNSYPGLDTGPQADILSVAQAAGGGAPFKVGFGSEAGLFSEMVGLPAVVCGPGSIDRAHKPDEYITQGELDECDAFLQRVVEMQV